jgi:hypothetical protein
MSRQLPKALPVDGVSTRHFVRSTSGTKEEFLANRAVGFVLATFAIVIGVKAFVNTHSTVMTVLKVFSPTNAAKTTITTVIWFFVVGHPQITDIAMILSKLHRAFDAIVAVKTKYSKYNIRQALDCIHQ